MRHFLFSMVIGNLLFLVTRIFNLVDGIHDWCLTPLGSGITVLMMILAYIGILFFVVDSFRRQYDNEKELAVALAVVGVLLMGTTTVLYYFRWGWQPVRPGYKDEFCETCLTESTELSGPLNLSTLNYVLGGRLIGNADQCQDCGSSIRTHCFYLFGFPVYSAGSFRVQFVAESHFLCRQVAFHWPHIASILIMPTAIVLFVVFLVCAN